MPKGILKRGHDSEEAVKEKNKTGKRVKIMKPQGMEDAWDSSSCLTIIENPSCSSSSLSMDGNINSSSYCSVPSYCSAPSDICIVSEPERSKPGRYRKTKLPSSLVSSTPVSCSSDISSTMETDKAEQKKREEECRNKWIVDCYENKKCAILKDVKPLLCMMPSNILRCETISDLETKILDYLQLSIDQMYETRSSDDALYTVYTALMTLDVLSNIGVIKESTSRVAKEKMQELYLYKSSAGSGSGDGNGGGKEITMGPDLLYTYTGDPIIGRRDKKKLCEADCRQACPVFAYNSYLCENTGLADQLSDQLKCATFTTFQDIIGMEEEKRIVSNSFIEPFIYTSALQKSKGILLYGPPGTGKTMLTRGIAREIYLRLNEGLAQSQFHVIFYAMDAGSLKSKWVGESEKAIKSVYDCAEAAGKTIEEESEGKAEAMSIIFMDEIDTLTKSRTATSGDVGTANSTGQLLQEIDGIIARKNVATIGATNLPWDIDSGILRRFSRQIFVDLPSNNAAKLLFADIIAAHFGAAAVDIERKEDDTADIYYERLGLARCQQIVDIMKTFMTYNKGKTMTVLPLSGTLKETLFTEGKQIWTALDILCPSDKVIEFKPKISDKYGTISEALTKRGRQALANGTDAGYSNSDISRLGNAVKSEMLEAAKAVHDVVFTTFVKSVMTKKGKTTPTTFTMLQVSDKKDPEPSLDPTKGPKRWTSLHNFATQNPQIRRKLVIPIFSERILKLAAATVGPTVGPKEYAAYVVYDLTKVAPSAAAK